MGEKGQIEGVRSPRTSSHSWGLHNYLQMSGPQIHFCPNYMIDCPKGPEFPLNNCIMSVLCFSWGGVVTKVKQMWLISPGSPKAFQEVIYSFWTGQNQPCLRTQESQYVFQVQRTKMCISKDKNVWLQMKSTLDFLHREKKRLFKAHWCWVWKWVCAPHQIQRF